MPPPALPPGTVRYVPEPPVIENPNKPPSKIAQECDISRKSVTNILRKHHYHRYKIKLVQELSEDDYDRRVEYCDEMITRVQNNRQFLYWVCFFDEATFELNGSVNRQNCRY